ncbi:hypothetical protein ABLO27_14410 [Roseibium sp. SCPC15]|uniref:hypothetical protein n=1 Tax=Roseibium sp. SCP15 TaxID=3141376 RepID=UPI003336BC4E
MIHPHAAADPFSAPLHRSFLISCFASGTVALFVLPLHLALAGAPHLATILVLAWMLSQWPLALYLSQSGALDRAIGISSALFACFVAAVCFLTGGSGSFALLWLLMPPIEAAFATDRRIAAGITALCAALLAAVTLLPPVVTQLTPMSPATQFFSSLAAILYAGTIALRISRDRNLAKSAVSASETKRRMISQNVSEVLCEIDQDGHILVMGGAVQNLVGITPSSGEDWLFPRLHVADRPLYLTKLSEARHDGTSSVFSVRLRVGSTTPGEAGSAEYRVLEFSLRPVRDAQDPLGSAEKLLLVIKDQETPGAGSGGTTADNQDPRVAKVSWSLVQNAGDEARKSLTEIRSRVSTLETAATTQGISVRDEIRHLRSSCDDGLSAMTSVLETIPGREKGRDTDHSSVEVGTCLENCNKLLAPVAAQSGVSIEIDLDFSVAKLTADRKVLRQSLCFILSDMIETAGIGATILVSGAAVDSELQLIISVKNRQSSLNWNSANSGPVLEFADEMLSRAGGSVAVHNSLGQGESVMMSLPTRAVEPAGELLTLAKTA